MTTSTQRIARLRFGRGAGRATHSSDYSFHYVRQPFPFRALRPCQAARQGNPTLLVRRLLAGVSLWLLLMPLSAQSLPVVSAGAYHSCGIRSDGALVCWGSDAAGQASPRPLLDFALDEEQVWACTTCGACIDACPVGNEPMLDIVDLRRERVLMAGEFPAELQQAFRGMERTGNPWGLSQDDRLAWAEGLEVPTVEERPDFEVLFWVGCAGAYDPGAQRTTRAMAEVLEHAGVRYAVLGKNETCSGDPARRAGNEYLYYQLATQNVAVLDEALATDLLDAGPEKRIVTACPHCYNALLNDYPQLGGVYRVVHHTQLLDELVTAGRLPPLDLGAGTTYHDPCYLGRHGGEYDAPRRVLTGEGVAPVEMPRTREKSFCCGAGGAQFWKEEAPGREKVADARMREAAETGAATVAAACPFCASMLGSSSVAGEEGAPEVVDVAVLYRRALQRVQARLQA